jgi:5-methylcytosine-specific restriction protein B
MTFKPSEITKLHVLKGIEEIKKSKKPLTDGTRWEVIIDGKSYPPKEVMRFAREQFDGSKDWQKGGGWPTNEFLDKMGFEVREKHMKEIISLGNKKIFKFSMGVFLKEPRYRNVKIIERLENLNLIVMHENTKNGQGNLFINNLQLGDYVYITYGRERLGALCKIKSDILELPQDLTDDINEDGYKSREIEIIKNPLINNTLKLKTDKRAWLPSGYTTIYEVRNLQEANELLFEEYYGVKLVNDIFENNQNEIEKKTPMNYPLNQILYGPPGTGKTYNTVLEAAKIITGNGSISYLEALDEFNNKLGNQIEFITFHQNYSYEDFIQGIRPDTENGKELTFEKKDGVFKRIADRALKNITDSDKPEAAKQDFDDVFQDFILPLIEEDEIEVKMKKTSFYITQISEKSIEFRKNQGDSQHTLSINTLRKMYNDGVNEIILGGLQPYYNPILQVLLEKGKSQFTPVEKKNFVIIIDEINRANISRVFGELITLIEEDKRSHGKIPMRVTLPSGDSFIVPSNLYIIGTMNTADKSIALLDIALRRRFDFVPMYPLYDGLEEKIYDADKLQNINDAILIRKSHDFTIGHAYFMGDGYTLENTINKKVIPLLLEYFMNDEKEVTAILQAAAITIGGWPLKMLS